ncbi:transforming acidic coiled-coil-containing protein 1 isoform X1 [Sinocyclocheilus grahami]|uniref:transforming acidic coiled-coil-containing protein 1 isoform X1 n=1 Tax=Sinocyclocheilus grahami TaxID=75366 RepID=UPI0007ACD8F6|nr:PREDICTED: transforming acidic coiled-coil-containing protein 1-like isoform X1 [Sinocyclocheilus grahami]
MSWLSPVQWAKWTWSAVRGGGEEEGETDLGMDDEALTEEAREAMQRDQEDDERSHGCSSDSEGQFETPEAETPVHQPYKEPPALDQPITESTGFPEVNQLTSITTKTQNLTLEESFPEDAPASVVQQSSVDPSPTLKLRNQPSSADMDVDQPEPAEAETTDETNTCNGHIEEPSSKPQTKSLKPRPPSLKVKAPLNGVDPNEVDDDPPILPKGSYNFDPDQFDDAVNPFATRGSKLQNSLPANASIPKSELTDEMPAQPVMLEFGLDDAEAKRPPPKKSVKKTSSKLITPRKQRPKAAETAAPPPETSSEQDQLPSEDVAPMNVDDIPIPKKSYNFDPSQWDDPNFNPFGGNSKPSNLPTLSEGSYNFDPDNFDDSIDPFKPSKTLGGSDTIKPTMEKLTDKHKPEGSVEQRKKAGQSPKKNKDRIITNSCKVKKYENQSLVLDVCNQEKDEQEDPASKLPHRVHHATDEEKLASTVMGQKDGPEDFSDCTKTTTSTKTAYDLPVGITDQFDEKDLSSPSESLCKSQTLSSSDSETIVKTSPGLDSIPLSEIDKAAVLTLIREEIIAKEIEANEWKRKYEESRLEVIEMRKIVDEYEKTVAQMIEDEQRKNIGSQKSVHQLTLERDQALADLNSVERSLSDLFRRYENMKTVLEGFKKNEEVLKKCAQDYLTRVRQEEQRYQTLKIHAEEKLDKANEEIAQVRSKANAESVALNASLRKEQMKAESMERALEQKNQEIEELSKICDELIAKLGTTD